MRLKLNFSLVYGILFALGGIGVGLFVYFVSSRNNDKQFFFVFSGLGGFLTAYYASKFLVVKKDGIRFNRFFWTSILVGLLSHWTCWYLMILFINIDYWLLDSYFHGRSLNEPINILIGLPGAFGLCIWSWIFCGWLTVPLSILALHNTKPLLDKLNYYRQQRI